MCLKCSVDDFEPISTVAGHCYTFNRPSPSQPPRNATGTGIRHGLQLQLSPENQDVFIIEGDYGYRIVIHNPDELPRPESDGIAVGLNSTAYIGMRQVVSVDETKFSSGHQCRDQGTHDEARELSFPGYSLYSPSLCQTECLFNDAIESCGCIEKNLYVPATSRYSRLRTCTTPDLCCGFKRFDEVEDSCDCPPRCNTVEHSLTVSSSTNAYDFVGVNVFYESLILETRETTDSYTPWSLILTSEETVDCFLGSHFSLGWSC